MVIANERHAGEPGLEAQPTALCGIELRGVSRSYGSQKALSDVSLKAWTGEIHALLGPNGAGKTTLLRILSGLVDQDAGEIRFGGTLTSELPSRAVRQQVGLVPSGDRSFYLRLSGHENLVFFGRLHGLRASDARARAVECLEAVGLEDAGRKWVGAYSHGMQKRLSVARGLLMDPPILLVDEATHDLDPEGAQRVRDLTAATAGRGTTVIWTTQRVEEIRGFADRVTLLQNGQVRFAGDILQFIGLSATRRYVLQVAARVHDVELSEAVVKSTTGLAAVEPTSDPEQFTVALTDDVTLGTVITTLTGHGLDVIACREEQPEVERIFVELTRGQV